MTQTWPFPPPVACGGRLTEEVFPLAGEGLLLVAPFRLNQFRIPEVGANAGEGAGVTPVAMEELPPSVRSPVGAAGVAVADGVTIFLRDRFEAGEAEADALLSGAGVGSASCFFRLRLSLGKALASGDADEEASAVAFDVLCVWCRAGEADASAAGLGVGDWACASEQLAASASEERRRRSLEVIEVGEKRIESLARCGCNALRLASLCS